MSIIYEALQKTQLKRNNPYNNYSTGMANKSFSKVPLIVVAIVACLLVFISYEMFKQPANLNQVSKENLQTQIQKVASPKINTLLLKGVYISDQEKLALINNQTVHVGDIIGGMQVVSINFNRVMLQSDGHSVVLTE